MKVALVLSILVLLIGLGYSFKLSDFFEDDTQRQSEVEDQILPVFTIAFFASLFNSLFFGINNQNSCQCGMRGPNRRSGNRIVGGVDAEIGEFPWIVRIEIDGGAFPGAGLEYCGGTLLSSDTVVTLASCVGARVPNTIGDWRVIVGDHDRSTNDGEQTIAAREIILHPDFDTINIDTATANNFAIVKLATPVTFSNRVSPICLPTASTDYNDRLSTVAGWGTAAGVGGVLGNSDILQELEVRTTTVCPAAPFALPPIGPSEICADGPGEIGLNDQGGPLITDEGRFFSLIGIASTTASGRYARVTSGLTWINQQISGNTCPTPN